MENKQIFSRQASTCVESIQQLDPLLAKYAPQPKQKRRRYRPEDPDFIPPDGGWGWVVCFACGLSNYFVVIRPNLLSQRSTAAKRRNVLATVLKNLLCLYPVMQQFGLIFSEKFEILGITGAQTSTIVNVNLAMTSVMGLINGPLYRKFSFRQVGMLGSIISFISIILLTISNTFLQYLFGFSIFFGIGMGFSTPAYSLALNTYFKEKRRMATGFSWTATALGPVVMPQLITVLLDLYGVQGTTLIFAGVAANAFFCSTLLQPVHWHTKYRDEDPEKPDLLINDEKPISTSNGTKLPKNASFISAQYVFSENDTETPGYEIIDPGTPMLCAGNDGYFTPNRYGSKLSLASNKASNHPANYFEIDSRKASYSNLTNLGKEKKEKSTRKRKMSNIDPNGIIQEETTDNQAILEEARNKLEQLEQKTEETEPVLSFWQKVMIFFDLDLLRDAVFVNIMVGLTLAMFAEMNFSILTPFILKDFHFDRPRVAAFMSTVGTTDIIFRFITPFLTAKISLDNRALFLVGIGCLATGRILLSLPNAFLYYIPIGILIGFGKALRTIFMALVIPSYVPLTRLPAATGLQLVTTGMFCLGFGSAFGWLKDFTHSFQLPVYFLSFLSFATITLWTVEMIVVSRHKRKDPERRNSGLKMKA